MSVASVLASGRRAAQRRMGAANGGSTVRVWRKTGFTTTHPETGFEVEEWAAIHLDEPSRLRGARGDGAQRTYSVGGVEVTEGLREQHFRHDLADLAAGDVVEIVAGEWAGSYWLLLSADPGGDQQTARRLPVMSTDQPEGAWMA